MATFSVLLNGDPGHAPDGKPTDRLMPGDAKILVFDLVRALCMDDFSSSIVPFFHSSRSQVTLMVRHHGGIDSIDMVEDE